MLLVPCYSFTDALVANVLLPTHVEEAPYVFEQYTMSDRS